MENIKSRGLGDTIDKFTTSTGIKAVVKAINPNCNCEERKEWLNNKISYNNNV